MLLPIFLNQIQINVLFLDEITSGLDDETHNIIRKLLDLLKTKYEITIVNIDHHTYDAGQCTFNLRKVRDGICPWEENSDSCNDCIYKNKLPWYAKYAKYIQKVGLSYKYTKLEEIKEVKKELSFPPEIEIV